MSQLEPYEVYAVKYGVHQRGAAANFLGGDPHDAPMPLDYFVWAIVGTDRTFVVDTGFDPSVAARRGRTHLRCPGDGLGMLGIDIERVEDVIVTHMHYDHCGNHHLFSKARFHVQDAEMAYATGRCMCHAPLAHTFDVDDVCAMVRRLFDGRLQFHDKVDELAPGLTLHHIGGHSMGLQSVRVWTRRGWVVLASDATHFYANMEQSRPFPIVQDLAAMLEGYKTLERLASSHAHIIPGHDPLVLKRYPAPREELRGIAARLDVEPTAR